MKNVLITGASGLLGSELLQILAKDSDLNIYGLSRKKSLAPIGNYHHLPLDLSSDRFITDLPENIDYIFHLAQSEDFRQFPNKAESIYKVNINSTFQLLEYARKKGAKKFIYTSSGGVYGPGQRGFLEEEKVLTSDLGFYLSTKLCSEILLDNYKSIFDIILLRPFFIYGKSQRKSMLIPRLVSSIIEGRAIKLQGETGIIINPIHVNDAAFAISQCLSLQGSHLINIAGKESLSLKQIGEIIGVKANKKPVFDIDQSQGATHILGDITKMKDLLGYPKLSFEQGMSEFF